MPSRKLAPHAVGKLVQGPGDLGVSYFWATEGCLAEEGRTAKGRREGRDAVGTVR